MFRSTDRPFDLDHDGRLNFAEEALKYEFMDHYIKSARGEAFGGDDDDDPDNDDWDGDDF